MLFHGVLLKGGAVAPVGLCKVMARCNPNFSIALCADVNILVCDLYDPSVDQSLSACGASAAAVVCNY